MPFLRVVSMSLGTPRSLDSPSQGFDVLNKRFGGSHWHMDDKGWRFSTEEKVADKSAIAGTLDHLYGFLRLRALSQGPVRLRRAVHGRSSLGQEGADSRQQRKQPDHLDVEH